MPTYEQTSEHQMNKEIIAGQPHRPDANYEEYQHSEVPHYRSIPEYLPRDDQALDLVGVLTGGAQPPVAVHAFQFVPPHVAVTATGAKQARQCSLACFIRCAAFDLRMLCRLTHATTGGGHCSVRRFRETRPATATPHMSGQSNSGSWDRKARPGALCRSDFRQNYYR